MFVPPQTASIGKRVGPCSRSRSRVSRSRSGSADTFFGVELPALTEWTFGPEQAPTVRRPVLSVIGADTQPLGEDRRVPPLLTPAGRGAHSRGGRPSPAHPAPRTRRPRHGGVPGAQRDRRDPLPIPCELHLPAPGRLLRRLRDGLAATGMLNRWTTPSAGTSARPALVDGPPPPAAGRAWRGSL
jgi:hypothetical protein